MKYVIEIKEEEYAGIVKSNYPNDQLVGALIYALKNGKPLPKGHGRLIDADKMMARLCKDDCKQTNGECKYFTRCSFWDAVQEAETIIEADKESEDNNAEQFEM